MVDGHARSFHFRSFRNVKDAAMSIEADCVELYLPLVCKHSAAVEKTPPKKVSEDALGDVSAEQSCLQMRNCRLAARATLSRQIAGSKRMQPT